MTSRFHRRVARDLHELANTVTPSDNAWASIHQRIEAPAEPDLEVVMLTDNREARARRHRRWGAAAATAAAVVMLAIAIVAWPSDDEGIDAAAAPTPPEVGVIEGYRDAYNDLDFDAAMAFFTERSIIVDHPFGTATGLAEIGELHRNDLSAAGRADAYSFDNLRLVDGLVTWDHRWTNGRNEDYCGSGHQATVEDGKILRWEFPSRGLCEDQ